MCQQKMSEEASLREEKACPDCPMTKNRPEMGLEKLVELSTISNGCTLPISWRISCEFGEKERWKPENEFLTMPRHFMVLPQAR